MVFGMAHHDETQSREATRRCLASRRRPAVFERLRSSSIRSEAELYIEGSHLDRCPALATFIGELKFGYCVERLVEGDHARTSRAFKHAPAHSEAFDSLANRMGGESKMSCRAAQASERSPTLWAR